MNGIVLLDKPAQVTSFQALGILKKKLETGKVGHTGTLDKFAHGLLIACTGKYTRLAQYITALPKEYIAQIEFGKTTSTLDPEGEIVSVGSIPSLDQITAAIPDFIGHISQKPPAYSAVHINGKRAYQRVRAGEAVEPVARNVMIDSIEILEYEPPLLRIRVNCRKGTYIRSLARDIGEACDTCAYVTELQRTCIGDFSVKEAVAPQDFSIDEHLVPLSGFLQKLDGLESCVVDNKTADRILYGKKLDLNMLQQNLPDGSIALVDEKGELLAVVEKKKDSISYTMVFAQR